MFSQYLKGYRTFILNMMSIVLTTIIWIGPDLINLILRTDLTPIVSEKYIPLVMVALGFLNIVLRKLTTTEIFKAK